MFLSHFDVFCHLLLNRRTATKSCPWLPLPGWYGCAHALGTGQTVGWCSSVSLAFIVVTLNLFVLCNNKTNYWTKSFFISKYLNIRESRSLPRLSPLWRTQKKPFDVIYYLYKMKQFHWSLCVATNCDWSRKITPLSNLASLLVEWKFMCLSMSSRQKGGRGGRRGIGQGFDRSLWPGGRAFELSSGEGISNSCKHLTSNHFLGWRISVTFDLTFFPRDRESYSTFLENVKSPPDASPNSPPPPPAWRLDIDWCITAKAELGCEIYKF